MKVRLNNLAGWQSGHAGIQIRLRRFDSGLSLHLRLIIMKVGIIGFGFVGNALFKGMKKSVDIIKIDPKLGTDINDLISFEPDFVFISVPTPMNDDGAQDLSILNSVFDQIKDSQLNTTLILKSTVTPENLHHLEKKLEFVYNPEF